MKEKIEVEYNEDKTCIFIKSQQYISLKRFHNVVNELTELHKQLEAKNIELEKENKTLNDYLLVLQKRGYINE